MEPKIPKVMRELLQKPLRAGERQLAWCPLVQVKDAAPRRRGQASGAPGPTERRLASMVARMQFKRGVGGECCFAILSNRCLYAYFFELRGFFRATQELTNEITIPLSRITSTSKGRHKSWFARPIWELQIGWEEGRLLLVSAFDQAESLRDIMEDARFHLETGPAKKGVAEELAGILALKEVGALTAEEWDRAKTMFLGAPPDRAARATDSLKKLHELTKAGVLTPGEFNMKKWDILSQPN